MWNDRFSKIKGPTAVVLFLELKWFFSILKVPSNATFFTYCPSLLLISIMPNLPIQNFK